MDGEGPGSGAQLLREFDNIRVAVAGQGALAVFDAPWTPIYLLCCFLLHPTIGMPVELVVFTRKRTALQYLFEPPTHGLFRAGRER